MPISDPCPTSNTEYQMEQPIINNVRVKSPGYLDHLKFCCLVKPVLYNSYLIVRQMHILHGQHCQLVRSCRITPVLHVSCNSKQLRGSHYMRCSINDDLIRCLKGQCFILTQGQSIQGTVWGILKQRYSHERTQHDLQIFQAPQHTNMQVSIADNSAQQQPDYLYSYQSLLSQSHA